MKHIMLCGVADLISTTCFHIRMPCPLISCAYLMFEEGKQEGSLLIGLQSVYCQTEVVSETCGTTCLCTSFARAVDGLSASHGQRL